MQPLKTGSAILLVATLSFGSTYSYAQSPILADSGNHPPAVGEQGKAAPVVLDVVLHNREDITKMLKRAESLAMTPNPSERPRQISLVLHGPEIEHFQISRYQENREIVDLAAKLDAFNIIDIKMCSTRMNMMGVPKQDVPAFVEIVPFGPDEVKRLESEGYINL